MNFYWIDVIWLRKFPNSCEKIVLVFTIPQLHAMFVKDDDNVLHLLTIYL